MEVLIMRLKRLSAVITILIFLLVATVGIARTQRKESRWTVVQFPPGRTIDVDFRVVNFQILRSFPRSTAPVGTAEDAEPETTSASADSPGLKALARVTRGDTNTSIEFRLSRFPQNAVYHLYAIDPFGGLYTVWKLTTSDSETTIWHLDTGTDSFMLALSTADTLKDVETDTHVFMISSIPNGVVIVDKPRN